MKTVLETLQSGAGYFEKHGVESSRLEMEHLLAHVLECERLQLYLDFDRPLEEGQLAPLRELVKRRADGEPLQHLLGTVEFCGRQFKCDDRALIPRPETEELTADLLKRELPAEGDVLDLGTGSGVIGLTLAAGFPDRRAVLADISPEALSLARENAALLEIAEDRADFVESDLFGAVDGQFALIAANLPYIADADRETLSREVLRDPESALFAGETGLEIIERLVAAVPDRLVPGGLLALEIGAGQAAALTERLNEAGFGDVEVGNDCAGIERFLFARKNA